MGKPQPTQLPNYQNAIKVKMTILKLWSWRIWRCRYFARTVWSNNLILQFQNFSVFQVWLFDYYILINEIFLVIKRKWELRDYTHDLDNGDLAKAEREWTAGMLGSEGGVFFALDLEVDLECLERDLGRRFQMEEADMVPKKRDSVASMMCLLCLIVLCES